MDGGAARAAYRIHQSFKAEDVRSRMLVKRAISDDWTVQNKKTKINELTGQVKSALNSAVRRTMRTENAVLHSPSIFGSNWVNQLNNSENDVINLHFLAFETMSISDIGAIQKPLVWTLHDMWAFCGCEHYTEDFRWRSGYNKNNRPVNEAGFDLNKWAWKRKLKHWKRPFHIVTPSNWLANCVRESSLMSHWPVSVIPYSIDTQIWRPLGRNFARSILGLPENVPLLLFGAVGGAKDPRKGFDLLEKALSYLKEEMPDLEIVIFGQSRPEHTHDFGFNIHYMGRLHDDTSLALLYSAVDTFVLPSRQDNLPNTGLEAQSCGTPVVAFNTGGLPDIVVHKKTGYLAEAFDAIDLAAGIHWVLKDEQRFLKLQLAARKRACEEWSQTRNANCYREVYELAIDRNSPNKR